MTLMNDKIKSTRQTIYPAINIGELIKLNEFITNILSMFSFHCSILLPINIKLNRHAVR